jgi:hypothetical protein
MRRTFALLRALPPRALLAVVPSLLLVDARRAACHRGNGRPRAPPAFS